MNILGFTTGDLIGLLILAIVIGAIWLGLKFVLKMTAGVLKMGCLVGVLIVAAVALLLWLI
jgi:hypothetical protein